MIRAAGWLRVAAISLILSPVWACSEQTSPPSAPGASGTAPRPTIPSASSAPARTAETAQTEQSEEKLAERGRSVYVANCTACHGMDPTQPGGLGPEIAGSSRVLIEARVLHAAYPDGYSPKRDTKLMVALPYLKDDIDALAAYLDASAQSGAGEGS